MWRHLIELSGGRGRAGRRGTLTQLLRAARAYLLSGHDVVGPYDGVQYLLQFHAAHGQVGRLGNALEDKLGLIPKAIKTKEQPRQALRQREERGEGAEIEW